MQDRVQPEPGHDTAEHDHAPDQQLRVGDGAPFLQCHHLGDAIRVVLERLREQHPGQHHEHHEDDDHDRRHVHEEVVERQARRPPMMMLGGSPMSVAAPPMLEASTSAIRYGCARIPSRLQTTTVTGATSMTVDTVDSHSRVRNRKTGRRATGYERDGLAQVLADVRAKALTTLILRSDDRFLDVGCATGAAVRAA
jgi:hypothetical protein